MRDDPILGRRRHRRIGVFALLTLLLSPVQGPLAATLTWIGPAAGDWDQPGHWSGGALPGAGDAVIIGAAGPVTVTHAVGDTLITSLQLTGSLQLAGGSLTISQPSAITGHLALAPGAALTVTGAGTSLDISGSADLAGGALIARDGARITLPAATLHAGFGTLRAQGADSRLELLHRTSIGIPPPEPYAGIDAVSRSVTVQNGVLDDSLVTVLHEAVSRAIAVYNGPPAGEDQSPARVIKDAVSRAVGVYNDPLAGEDQSPARVIKDAVSRSVGVYNDPLAGEDQSPARVIKDAVSRAVGVYNDPLAGEDQTPARVIKDAASRAVGVTNGTVPPGQ